MTVPDDSLLGMLMKPLHEVEQDRREFWLKATDEDRASYLASAGYFETDASWARWVKFKQQRSAGEDVEWFIA
jgi:hypothetical protein